MTALLLERDEATALDDDIVHLFCCCSPDNALCGADVTGDPIADDDAEPECVVCEDLCAIPCPRCGFTLDGPCACGRCAS